MKKFILKRTLEHLVEASILCVNVDPDIARAINDISAKLVSSNTPKEEVKLSKDAENELKERLSNG